MMNLLRRIFLAFVLLGSIQAGIAQQLPEQDLRVLFVGNSVTYVGNLPAVFSALANANGRSGSSDMIVQGGATLSQRVQDQSVREALQLNNYDVLVLQERGGDLIEAFGPEAARQSETAIAALAELGQRQELRVVLLGTYQQHPDASKALSEAEAAAALDAGIEYIDLSNNLHNAAKANPDLEWFASDSMHPGNDLTLLAAVLLFETIIGELPQAKAFQVEAPIYGVKSGLSPELRNSHDDAPLVTTIGTTYNEVSVSRWIDALQQSE